MDIGWYFFAIPSNEIISQDNSIEVKSIRKKSTPVFGKVESIIWEPNNNSKDLAEKFIQDEDINMLSMRLGNIKIQSLHDNFSGFSIELEFKVKDRSLDFSHWETLNRISSMCLEL